jgi:hypothetical protein
MSPLPPNPLPAQFHGFPVLKLLDTRLAGLEEFALFQPWPITLERLRDRVAPIAGLPAGTIIIQQGFVFDGESVPLFARSLTGQPCLRAGAGHDYLYRTHLAGEGEPARQLSDACYLDLMVAAGIPRPTAIERWEGVHLGGRSSWETGPARLRVVTIT